MEQLDNRGQTALGGTAKSAVVLVVGIAVLALMAAFLAPVAIGALEDDVTDTLNQTTSETYEVNTQLESTVTATTAGSDATIELNDTRTAGTTSNTINVSENATYSLEGGDVVVTLTESQSGYAIADYEYAKDYTFGDAAQSLWGLIGFALVLLIFLFAIQEALNQM